MRHLFSYGLACALAALGMTTLSLPANADSPTAIYGFQGGNDGKAPSGNLVADSVGNLYGVTYEGGATTFGVVFKLSPPSSPSTSWTETILHTFTNGVDGGEPQGGLVIDSGGNLYGTTAFGGGIPNCDCGVAFKLSPPSLGLGPWTFATIYRFRPVDGTQPKARMIFDKFGNLYGTTYTGGLHPGCCGVVFELSPPQSGHGFWVEKVLHAFSGSDGNAPDAGLTFDGSGNLYGTTIFGGLKTSCCGVVFELSPPTGGADIWAETVLHSFTGPDGTSPQTDLVFDSSGNRFGAAAEGAGNAAICGSGCGTVFELSPPVAGSTLWTEKTIYRFPGGSSALNPMTVAFKDAKLYGPAFLGGTKNQGALFVMSPATAKFWNIAVDSFTGNAGEGPFGSLTTDPPVSNGATFYGVTYYGGSAGYGTVYSWTP